MLPASQYTYKSILIKFYCSKVFNLHERMKKQQQQLREKNFDGRKIDFQQKTTKKKKEEVLVLLIFTFNKQKKRK